MVGSPAVMNFSIEVGSGSAKNGAQVKHDSYSRDKKHVDYEPGHGFEEEMLIEDYVAALAERVADQETQYFMLESQVL